MKLEISPAAKIYFKNKRNKNEIKPATIVDKRVYSILIYSFRT